MALQIVKIAIDGVSYDPNPPIVKQDDTVKFELVGRTDAVTVKFTEGCPFAQNNFGLDGSNLATASQTKTVLSTVEPDRYPFDVDPQVRSDPEPAGTVSGDLEVVTDPPPEDK